MGWTYLNRGGESAKEVLNGIYGFETPKVKSEVLDSAIVKLKTAYLAVRRTDKETGRSHVYAGVCLLDYAPHDHYDLGYKGMDESQGPLEAECPERILEVLSPVEEVSDGERSRGYAKRWREECWKKIRAREAAPPLKDGHLLVLEKPLDYGGEKKTRMLITSAKKRIGDRFYRIPSKARLAEHGYAVVAPGTTA